MSRSSVDTWYARPSDKITWLIEPKLGDFKRGAYLVVYLGVHGSGVMADQMYLTPATLTGCQKELKSLLASHATSLILYHRLNWYYKTGKTNDRFKHTLNWSRQ